MRLRRLVMLWREAQGIPSYWMRLWRQRPPKCLACGRSWRPDKSEYVAIWGQVFYWEGYGLRWQSDALNGFQLSIGNAQDHVRYLCHEHGDLWESVPDCRTGEMVELGQPLTRLQRAWRDVVYWGGTVLRFVWLLGATPFRRGKVYVRSAWPPMRQKG